MDPRTLVGSTQRQSNPSKIVRSNPNTKGTSLNIPVFGSLNRQCLTATIQNARICSLKLSSIKTSNHSRLLRNKLLNSRVNTVTKLKFSKSQNPASILCDLRKVRLCIYPRHYVSIDLSRVKFLLDGMP